MTDRHRELIIDWLTYVDPNGERVFRWADARITTSTDRFLVNGIEELAARLAAHDAEVRAEAQKEHDRAVDTLRDFADHGLRFDLNPTMMITTGPAVYTQWLDYVQRMDRSVRDRAAAALSAQNHTDGSTS